MKKLIAVLFLFMSLNLFGFQDKYEITDEDYQNNSVEMADVMRSNGKIYVVVAVVITIFAGIIVFMVRTDRKIKRIEQEVFEENHTS